MIAVRDVTYAYGDGDPALAGASLEIGSETLALMGPNGAGKTTLLKCIAGLYDPDAGTVTTDDATVGFAPEDPDDALFAASVAKEVAYFPRNRGLNVEEAVDAALDEMGVAHLRDRVPQTLSAGEKRRVSLAAVLSGDPDVVALDEPTSGLDAPHVEALGEAIRALDRTVVLATHDAEFARRYADRVAIVDDGTVVRTGPAEALLGDPGFDFEAVGVRPPGAVRFARARGWADAPTSVPEAAARLDEDLTTPPDTGEREG